MLGVVFADDETDFRGLTEGNFNFHLFGYFQVTTERKTKIQR